MALPLSQVYVGMIRSFKADCEKLIDKFIEMRSEDFRDFVSLWKELKFNLIYEKYARDGLLYDLKEDSLQIAKTICQTNYKILVKTKYARDGLLYDLKEDSLQIAKTIMLKVNFVGGMFLLYGLYYVQEEPRPNIRIEYNEFEKMVRLLRVERKTLITTCQPGFMFSKLMKNSAFAFVRFSRDFSMEGQNRARLVFDDRLPLLDDEKKVDAKEWLNSFLQTTDVIDELKEVEKEYFKKKQKLKEEHPQLNLALDMVPDDFVKGLQKTLTQDIFSEQQVEESGENTQRLGLNMGPPVNESIGAKRRRLKLKNMKVKQQNPKFNPKLLQKEENVECSKSSPAPPRFKRMNKKRTGAPRGQRKLYFKVLMNESESCNSGSESDDPTSSLPAAKTE